MPENELIVSLSELTRLEFVCQNEGCSGSLTLDLNRNYQLHTKCPVCEQQLVTGIYPIANAWQKFFKELTEAKAAKVQFRIKRTGTPLSAPNA